MLIVCLFEFLAAARVPLSSMWWSVQLFKGSASPDHQRQNTRSVMLEDVAGQRRFSAASPASCALCEN